MRSIAGVAAFLIAWSCSDTQPAPPSAPEAAPELGRVDERPAPPLTARVRGRVLTPDGGPVPAFTVEVMHPGAHAMEAPRLRASFDGAPDGAFELGDLPAGPLVVVVVADGFAPTRGAQIEGIPDVVVDAGVVRLERGGSLTGRVLAARDGAPAAGALVEARLGVAESHGPAFTARARTDPDGRFVLDHLAPGRTTLVVRAPHLATACSSVVVEAGARVELEPLRLVPGATLSGVVRGEDGQAFAAAAVQLTPLAPETIEGHRQTRTDAAGRYVLEHVSPGGWQISASRAAANPFVAIDDMRASMREIAVVEEARELELDLVIARP